MKIKQFTLGRIGLLVEALLSVCIFVNGAILTTEDFSLDDGGWATRDGEMTVTRDAGNEWMQGTFAGQGFPIPQTDAFRLDSGTDFLDDYTSAGITQIQLQMYAADVLPSDLFIRLIDGANVFSYQFSPLGAMLNNWATFTVDLTWSFGWSGPGSSQFTNALTGIDAIEIQLSRNGTGAQSYYFDNFQTLDTEIDEGGPPSAVPEPASVSLIALMGVSFLIFRRRAARPVRVR